MEEGAIRSETWGSRGLRMLPMSPLQITLTTQNGNLLISSWFAFSLSLCWNLLDLYLMRKYGKPFARFPTILNSSSLLAYIMILICYYQTNFQFDSRFVGPIVCSCLTSAVMLSIMFEFPLTIESTSRLVIDEHVLNTRAFLRFNQWLTSYVLFWFVIMLILTWCATLFDKHSTEQIIVGIVLPVLVPFIIQLTTPCIASRLYALRKRQTQDEQEETTPFVS